MTDLLTNDLSLHGQFAEIDDFRKAVGRIMSIRKLARRFGRELQCHSSMYFAQVGPELRMPQAAQLLSADERRSVL
jgi:hypothetical protein